MNEVERKIIKENGMIVFVTNVPGIVLRKEYVDKDRFKKTFDEVKTSLKHAKENLGSINKKLESVDTHVDEELEKFIDLANRAANYNQAVKLKEEKLKAQNDLKLIDQQLNDMLKVMPELARKPKK